MADVNANIGVHIDTSAALAELKALQRQLANFHSSVSKSSAAAAMAQKGLQTNLLNSINATGKFRAQMGLVRTSTESFTHALEKNKLSMREYFRYAGGSTRTFGKLFKQEFNTIGKVAEERVKKMQTQYIKMGRDASGAMKAISITPNTLNMKDYSTKLAVAAQKQAILNQLLRQGSTNLLNFGKNTQWAGRQLMVGFTVPLAYLGTAAAKTFMDLEKQAVRFRRVYGDMFTTTAETDKALKDIELLAQSFTKYGVAVVKTMEMAANAAAMGKTGADLTAQVAQATRLAVLGGVEQEQALETTISVTNAFGIAADDLAKKIDFLNAVENQTVVSIEDLTEAIPKAGPVVKQLGGSVEDLAFFLTAMKEGGINASEGANALKSGLASLINPSKKASAMLAGLGINIKAIVEGNQGNIKETVIDFAQALDTLDPLNRARAIEQLFGKFQFSRLSTLFQNVTKDGTQASRVLQLTTASVEELAIMSERELGTLEDAIGTDFKESIENLKLALAPIGKEFLKAITPVAKVLGNFLEKFNNLGDGTKKFIVMATTLVGVIGPVLLMTFGLLANGVANIIKLFITMRTGFHKVGTQSGMLAQQTQYLNSEQLESLTVATSLGQAHARLTQSFATETTAVRLLRQAYIDATIAATNFARTNPGMMMPGGKFKPGPMPKKFASGVDTVPGTGNKDTVPAMLTPGEAVVPADIAQDDKFKPLIAALVSGKIQKYGTGTTRVGDDYSHVGGMRNLNIDEILKDPRVSALEKQKLQTYKQVLLSQGKPPTIGSYGGLAYSFDSSLNKAMATKQGVSIGAFENAWTSRGADKWMASNIPASQAKIIDDAILKQIKASGVTKVTDGLVEQTFKNLPPNIKSSSAYAQMSGLHSQLGSYGIGRGLGSNPKTSEKILAEAKKKGYIKDYKIETRTTSKGAQATKSMIVTNLDGTQSNLGRGSKTNRQYISDTQDTRRKSGLVTGQTGKAKSSALSLVGGASSDNRQVAVGKNETILNKKTTSALRSGRGVSVPGIGRFGLIGADLGVPKGQSVTSPGMAVSAVEKQFRAEQKSLRRQIEKVEKERVNALKQETKMIQEKTAVTEKQIPLTKEQIKSQKKEARANRSAAIGRVAGPVAGIAGIGAMAGFMTGNTGVGTAMMGVSALATIAPMLTNPIGIAVAAAATLAGGFFLLNKRMDDATKKQVAYVDSVTAGTKKMQQVGELTGKVGASQLAQKQRETGARTNEFRTGYDREDNQFGTNFLASDVGKSIFKGFNDTVAKDGPKAAKLLATQLAAYISDGVMTAEQANSVARAIGINLGDMSVSTNISGELRTLIGPDGQDILKNPLKVRLSIITAQENFIDDIKDKLKVARSDEFVAQVAVINAKNLEIVQAQRDAQYQTNQAIIDGLEKQKATTTDKTKQLELENQIITAKAKQKSEDTLLAEKSKQIIKDAENLYNSAIGNRGKFMDALGFGIEAANKDNPFLSDFKDKIAAISNTQAGMGLEVQIKTAVLGGQLNIPTALKLLEMFGGTQAGEAKLKTVIETTLTSQDPGVFQRFMEIMSGKNVNPKIQMDILTDQKNFEDVTTVLNKLKDFDGDALNLEVLINTIGLPGLTKLAKQFKAVEKIKSPITVKTLAEISTITDDPTLNMSGLVDIWSKYENASDVIKKTVIQEYISVFKSLGPEEAKNFIQNEIAKGYGFGENSERKVAAIKSKYVNPDGTANLPAIAATLVSQSAVAAPNKIPKGTKGAGDGGKKEDPFVDLLRRLKLVKDSTINVNGGLIELQRILAKGGGDIPDFLGMNQLLRAQGITEEFIQFVGGLDAAVQKGFIKIDKETGAITVLKAGEDAARGYAEAISGEFNDATGEAITLLDAQTTQFTRLMSAGYDAEEALELINDAQVAQAIKNGETNETIDKQIIAINKLKEAQQKFLEDTDPEKAFDIEMGKAMKYYDFLERKAEAAAKPEIDRLSKIIEINEDAIDSAQRNIEINYDRKIDTFNDDLAVIAKSTEEINKKYDEQEKALNKISEINQEIAEQEKGRLTLADALSRGDISAAASAAQEMRANAAANATEKNSGALQAARELEIARLQSRGLTKAQIEAEIYKIEQGREVILANIKTLQDSNYDISKKQLEPLKEALKIQLDNIDTQRTAWTNQKLAIDEAGFAADGTNEKFKIGAGIVKTIADMWATIKDKNVTLTTTTVTTGASSSGFSSGTGGGIETTGRGGGFFRMQERMYGGKILPMAMGGVVPKYMVAGGGIGSDTVPAMLTPGEFVMNKKASQEFGPLLSMLNESKYPSMIGSSYDGKGSGGGGIATSVSDNSSNVYNYSVGITVPQSNANPNDIARAVIGQIKYIDNQRIRGQR